MFNDWRLKKGPIVPNKTTKDGDLTLEHIKEELSDSDDLIVKEIKIVGNKKVNIVCIDGLVDSLIIDQNIIKPLLKMTEEAKQNRENKLGKINMPSIFKKIENGLIPHIEMEVATKMSDVVAAVLSGCACLFITGVTDKAIIFDVKGYEKRPISEPTNENIIKGSKESFNETIRDNTGLLRRRIGNKDLKIKEFEVGNVSKTKVAVVYMEGIADKDILECVIKQIKKIDVDSIIAPAKFEDNFLSGSKSIFPSMIYTERVDKFAANLIEGEIGILIDGMSIGYNVPAVFNMFFQVPEDYSFNYVMASFIRIIRYIAAFFTIFVPGFYVAIATFHPEMIPTELSLSIIKSKEGVPFTSILEVVFMLIAFEMLIEAGARLPKLIGQTISIVGGLIVGEAAVNAKFTSPAVVVVIAIAGITGFLIPNQDLSNAFRIIRIILVIIAGMMGLYGLSLGLILALYYMAKKESFGVPYLIPFTSNGFRNLTKDTIVRGVMTQKE